MIALSLSPFATEVTTGAYRSACDGLGSGETCPLFIPSWHDNPLFIEAWEEQVHHGLKRFWTGRKKNVVFIFTSHSIPVRYITAGDPYQQQVEEAVRLVVAKTGIKHWRVAWQSKGARAAEPWLEPGVEPTLNKAAAEGFKAVLEVPIGFPCDHMETLYDIDIVHRKHAKGLILRSMDGWIISNSTFGWWACYLGDKDSNKHVCVPSPWFDRTPYNPFIYEPHWTPIMYQKK